MPSGGERSPWLRAGIVVLAIRIIFFGLAYVASYLLAGGEQGLPERDIFEIWVNFDASELLAIAANGYDDSGAPNRFAFFPLYPLAVRALSTIGLSGVIAGLLVSALASLVALAFLFRLVAEEAHELHETGAVAPSGPEERPGETADGEEAGRRAMLYLALFPTAVFLVAPYPEALFLAGAIPAFYFARRRRWVLVAPFAAIAVGTRPAGLFLVLGLIVEAMTQRLRGKELAMAVGALVTSLLPALAYMAYLGQTTGDPLRFVTAQRDAFGRSFTGPVTALGNTIDRWSDPSVSTNLQVGYRFEVLAALLGLAAVAWALRKRERAWAAYMGSAMGAMLLSEEYLSIPRTLLILFPIVILLARASARPRWPHETYLVGTATLAAIGVIVYTQGAWFF